MRPQIRTVIVEDEPLARQTIKDFLQGENWLELVGEAVDGHGAVRLIDELCPDLVFLDVKMPGLTGLQVLEAVQHDPEIVFTTAYDAHAVAAFELEALDYILKPFGRERFGKMLSRVKERLLNGRHGRERTLRERATRALNAQPVEPLVRMFVRDHRGRVIHVPLSEITHLVGADDYVEVHAGNSSYLVDITLTEFERRLDPKRFCRVHRSAIVNLDQIVRYKRMERRLEIELKDGARVVASRAGAKLLQASAYCQLKSRNKRN